GWMREDSWWRERIGLDGAIGVLPAFPWQAAHTCSAFSAPLAMSAACATPMQATRAIVETRILVILGFRMRAGCSAAGIVGREVGDVLFAQAGGDGAHRGMAAIALLVGHQRVLDVLGALPGDARHVIDHRIGRLVARNAMAADAHRDLVLRGLGVATFGGLAGERYEGERGGDEQGPGEALRTRTGTGHGHSSWRVSKNRASCRFPVKAGRWPGGKHGILAERVRDRPACGRRTTCPRPAQARGMRPGGPTGLPLY